MPFCLEPDIPDIKVTIACPISFVSAVPESSLSPPPGPFTIENVTVTSDFGLPVVSKTLAIIWDSLLPTRTKFFVVSSVKEPTSAAINVIEVEEVTAGSFIEAVIVEGPALLVEAKKCRAVANQPTHNSSVGVPAFMATQQLARQFASAMTAQRQIEKALAMPGIMQAMRAAESYRDQLKQMQQAVDGGAFAKAVKSMQSFNEEIRRANASLGFLKNR